MLSTVIYLFVLALLAGFTFYPFKRGWRLTPRRVVGLSLTIAVGFAFVLIDSHNPSLLKIALPATLLAFAPIYISGFARSKDEVIHSHGNEQYQDEYDLRH